MKVAIGVQLRKCKSVRTLGVKPMINDYDHNDRALLLSGQKIYFPTRLYASLFRDIGIPTYPGWPFYSYMGNKFAQTLLFQAKGIPHPQTRFYLATKKFKDIEKDFSFPFIAKTGTGSSGGAGVFLIKDKYDLEAYCKKTKKAYIQEYMPFKKDIRVILINYRLVLAYWRIVRPGEFRTNVKQGGEISFNPVPSKAIDLAVSVAKECGFDEAGFDIFEYQGEYYVMEVNMIFGTKGLVKAGIDIKSVRNKMIEDNII